MKFNKGEQKIAMFLNEYLAKTHGKKIAVCLIDENDIFCATNFDGKKIMEAGVSLLQMGNSEMEGVGTK